MKETIPRHDLHQSCPRATRSFSRLLALLGMVGISIVAMAQTWEVTFDENGNGSVFNTITLVTTPMPGVLIPDPSGGLPGKNVLVYTLPANFPLIVLGDIVLNERKDSMYEPSDLSRAIRVGGKQQIIFY